MGNLFVSYSRWDRMNKPVINQLLADLKTAGVSLWLVPDDIPSGADWQEAKPDGLKNADGILFLFGRPFAKTHEIANELAFAEAEGLPIIIAVITQRAVVTMEEYAASGEYHELFETHPVISVLDDYETGLRQLLDALPASVKTPLVRTVQEVTPDVPQSKGYVFISYAEEDSEFVEKLRAFLGEKGYGFWDYQSSERNFHTQLFLELEGVIQNASATLSILSPDWKKSSWTAKEYLYSEQVSVPVFLLMAREMGPTLVVAGVPYIDFSRGEAEGFERLDRALRRKGLI